MEALLQLRNPTPALNGKNLLKSKFRTEDTKTKKLIAGCFSHSTVWSNKIPNHCPWLLAHHRCQLQPAPDILLALRLRCPFFHSSTSSCHPTKTPESPYCNHMGVTSSRVVASPLAGV